MYKMSPLEKKYIKEHDYTKYERPSMTADIVAFSLRDEVSSDIRKNPESKLSVLLVKRAEYPFKGMWALPGGFMKNNQSIYTTARRVLLEETGIDREYMDLTGVYSDMGRDPRGWIVSQAFTALIDANAYKLRAGDEAWEAAWYQLDISEEELEREIKKNQELASVKKRIKLSLRGQDQLLTCGLIQVKKYMDYHETIESELEESEGLAFDHGRIIIDAIVKLRQDIELDEKKIFDFMPEYFTIQQLAQAHEQVTGKKLLMPNFRRKVIDYLIASSLQKDGVGYRPAKLYKRNLEKFYRYE